MSDEELKPCPFCGGEEKMTLRDYMAGQALVGYLSKHADVNGRAEYATDAVRRSYIIADAMLEARKNDR